MTAKYPSPNILSMAFWSFCEITIAFLSFSLYSISLLGFNSLIKLTKIFCNYIDPQIPCMNIDKFSCELDDFDNLIYICHNSVHNNKNKLTDQTNNFLVLFI